MFDGRTGCESRSPDFLTRPINACDNVDVPGTSSRRTQLFTFQGATGRTITGPALCGLKTLVQGRRFYRTASRSQGPQSSIWRVFRSPRNAARRTNDMPVVRPLSPGCFAKLGLCLDRLAGLMSSIPPGLRIRDRDQGADNPLRTQPLQQSHCADH